MTVLVVPGMEEEAWPTLGPAIADRMESHLIFGPGSLRGQPYRLMREFRAILYRAYEVHPRGDPREGRRRFKRVAVSLRKGSTKTEFLAAIAAIELDPDGPVRFDDWRKVVRRGVVTWEPVGRPVRDAFIPLMAYTDEQSEELAYGCLKVMLSEGPMADRFHVWKEEILRADGTGKCKHVASAPDANDGALTTFQGFDETHRLVLPNHKESRRTMQANLPKRPLEDPWEAEITTSFTPGENSVAEDTMRYAREIAEGKAKTSQMFFFHREASALHDLDDEQGVRDAVIDASGEELAAWSDIEAIASMRWDPTMDLAYWRRVWLNQQVQGSGRAFDVKEFAALAKPGYRPKDGALITLGFDGSRFNDSTGLVGTEVATGIQFVIDCWERPADNREWEVKTADVDAAVEEAFRRWNVWRMYADPYFWSSEIAMWGGRYGDKIVEFRTNSHSRMCPAVAAFVVAVRLGELHHDGDERYTRHIGNVHKREVTYRDEDGKQLWVMAKERDDSVFKIDLAVAGCLSWAARNEAVASGATGESVYETRGVLTT